jgi:hypothetical protein
MAKHLAFSDFRRIAELRGAGYSAASIAAKIGCNVSTVQRFCRRNAIAKGIFRREAIERTIADLMDDPAYVAELQAHVRALNLDTVQQVRSIREKSAAILEAIKEDDTVAAARALAAVSTSVRLSCDVLKSIETTATGVEPLPSLTVGVMSDEEIEEVKRANREGNDSEADDLDGDALAELFGDDG